MKKTYLTTLSLLLILFMFSCSDDSVSTTDIEVGSEIESIGQISQADDVVFDVEWEPGVILAEEEDVLNDVQDLMGQDGVYTIAAGSPLLDGLEVGDLVVWPQLGIFNILSIQEQGNVVDVTTEWARFSDAFVTADIQFRHDLTAGATGRAIGIAPAGERPKMGVAPQYGLFAKSAPISITEDGVEFSTGTDGYNFKMAASSGGTIQMDLSASSGGLEAALKGVVSGLTADGAIQISPDNEDPDPAIGVFFNDIQMDIDGTVSLSGTRGAVDITPEASLVFPFSIGPVPAFVAVSTRFQIRSSITRANAKLSATAGFSAVSDVAVGRNPDGNFAAQGELKSFSTTGPELNFEASNTSGMGFDFDAPRVTIGIGRPGLGTLGVYGTATGELVFNVTFNTDAEWCIEGSLGGAITVGGEINTLIWSFDRQRAIATRPGPKVNEGAGCSSGKVPYMMMPNYEQENQVTENVELLSFPFI